MPTYQYSCTECGHFFEQFQSFSDASLTTCPECSGKLRKVFNAVGVVFKGSGFYRTDSRADARSGSGSNSEGGGGGGKESTSGKDSSGGKEAGTEPSGTKKSGTDSTKSESGGSTTTKSSTKGGSSESAA